MPFTFHEIISWRSPFPCSLCSVKVISRVMESEGLRLLLMAPLWPQKECFADLLDLLIAEPFEFLRVWNLLAQPHVRKYHQGLKTFRLHAWSLSSYLYKRQDFQGRLRALQWQTSDAPQLPSTSQSRPDSLVGVIDGASIHARPLFL